MATNYDKLKVVELKTLLSERGIALTGLTRKQQFIDALTADDANGSAGDDAPADAGGDANLDEIAVARPDAKGADAETVEPDRADTERAETETAGAETGESETAGTAAAPEERAPIVLEKDRPVSDQPSRLPTPEVPQDASSDTRKRKHRSPTPPLSEESVAKKLRTAEEEPARLVGDEATEDAPSSVEGAPGAPGADASGDATENADARAGAGAEVESGLSDSVSPAVHPATRALYIRDLIRPLHPGQLREHLVSLASPRGGSPDDALVETVHVDVLRTHAFAVFTSIAAASRARAKLHGAVWPAEPTRKPLWVDFVPEDQAAAWIDTEQASGTSRRDAKRWEVVYHNGDDGGEPTATLQEVQPGPAPGRRAPSFSQPAGPETGSAPSTAPLGPRGGGGQYQPSATPTQAPAASAPADDVKPAPSADSFNVLDERFTFTATKPKLYYQPLGRELAERRLNELDRETSRDWDYLQREPPSSADGQLRRYTFEDGDRLVDGGPDRGSFGLPKNMRRGRGGAAFGGGRYRGR